MAVTAAAGSHFGRFLAHWPRMKREISGPLSENLRNRRNGSEYLPWVRVCRPVVHRWAECCPVGSRATRADWPRRRRMRRPRQPRRKRRKTTDPAVRRSPYRAASMKWPMGRGWAPQLRLSAAVAEAAEAADADDSLQNPWANASSTLCALSQRSNVFQH